MMNLIQRAQPSAPPAAPRAAAAPQPPGLFRRCLDELRDVLNPLQHLPILGGLYRAVTGDTLSGPAAVAGGFLYGGPFGVAFAAARRLLAHVSNRDVEAAAWQHVLHGPEHSRGSQVEPEAQVAALDAGSSPVLQTAAPDYRQIGAGSVGPRPDHVLPTAATALGLPTAGSPRRDESPETYSDIVARRAHPADQLHFQFPGLVRGRRAPRPALPAGLGAPLAASRDDEQCGRQERI